MKRLLAIAVIAVLALPSAALAQSAGFKIVVNKENPARGLAKTKLGLMFMKATTKWEHGASVEPVDQTPVSAVRAEFSMAVHNRDVATIGNVWQRAIFSGRGEPPPEKASDEEVIAYVSSHPGGIGYVSAGAPVDKVKVLDILK